MNLTVLLSPAITSNVLTPSEATVLSITLTLRRFERNGSSSLPQSAEDVISIRIKAVLAALYIELTSVIAVIEGLLSI